MKPAHQLDLLQELAWALRDGRPASPEVGAWLAPGLQAYIDAGGDLAKHLGLRARRGGRHDTPHMRRRLDTRDSYLAILIMETSGQSVAERVRHVADYLHGRAPAPRSSIHTSCIQALRKLRLPIPEEERLGQIYKAVIKSRFETLPRRPTVTKDAKR